MIETAALGIAIALHSYHDRQRPAGDVTALHDDVIKMAAATPAAWAEPNAQRVIAEGGGYKGRQLLCGLTATVRPAVPRSGLEGSGEEDIEKGNWKVDDDRLRRFTHFIFRNRIQISQKCDD